MNVRFSVEEVFLLRMAVPGDSISKNELAFIKRLLFCVLVFLLRRLKVKQRLSNLMNQSTDHMQW